MSILLFHIFRNLFLKTRNIFRIICYNKNIKEVSKISYFAKNLKYLRLKNGLEQSDLSYKLGRKSTSSVSEWERGKYTPKAGILNDIAQIFNVPLSDLMNKDIENEPIQNINMYTKSIPLLGTIAAGTPILATENIEEYFNIDSSVKADFALRIKGNSMINVGIHNNDIVFIKKQSTLENGQIGAILIEEEATLKRFFKADGHYILQPENNELSPILVKDEVQILGKYVACLHIESNS